MSVVVRKMSVPLTCLEQVRAMIKCCFCQRVSNPFFIQCALCKDTYFCPDCFCAGVTLPSHDISHPYRIPDCLETIVFAKDWSIKEELLLLDGTSNPLTIHTNILSSTLE